ncbi:MAG: DUF3788 family protein [Prolixibacteraceae bacterium]|nr:DUF3788 family protein [Prolixibacteraceae bacterium]
MEKNEVNSLKDPNILPTKEVLNEKMGSSYDAYVKLIDALAGEEFGIVPEWRYYNDGKSWLAKHLYKKKNMFWLSVWNNYFKVSFYFTDKNILGVDSLTIDEKIKESLEKPQSIGKLLPLTIDVYDESQVDDLLQIIRYKKTLK